jgi:hypothetical protein
MSGRRLADLFALASATRNIIRRHVDIQLQTVTRVAATSSVTKVLKRNFRRDTVHPTPVAKTASAQEESSKEPLQKEKEQDVQSTTSDGQSVEPPSKEELPSKLPPAEGSLPSKRRGPKSKTISTKPKSASPLQDQHVRSMSTLRPIPTETASSRTDSSPLRNEQVYCEGSAPTIANSAAPTNIPSNQASPTTRPLTPGTDSEEQHPHDERKVGAIKGTTR